MTECTKRSFTSPKAAREANKTMGSSIRPYWCETCHGFHVTKERYGYHERKLKARRKR